MALQRQVVSMPFAQGVDTKTDPKQLALGKLSILENGKFSTLGQVRKRASTVGYGAPLSAGVSIFAHQGALAVSDGSQLYANSNSGTWAAKGAISSVALARKAITSNLGPVTNTNIAAPDGARHSSGTWCFAWATQGTGTLSYVVFDEVNRTQVLAETTLSVATGVPNAVRVVTFGSYFFVVYFDGLSTIRYRAISVTSPFAALAEGTVASGVLDYRFDASVSTVAGTTRAFVAYKTSGGGLAVTKFETNFTPTTATPVLTVSSVTAVGVFAHTTGEVYLGFNGVINGVPGVRFAVVSASSLATLQAPTILDSTAATLDSISANVANGIVTFFYTLTVAGAVQYVALSGYTPGAPTVLARSVRQYGQPVPLGTQIYIPVNYTSAEQSINFLLDGTGRVVAKLSQDAVKPSSFARLYSTWAVGNVAYVPAVVSARLTSVAGVLQQYLGEEVVSVDFSNPVTTWLGTELANVLMITGGFPIMYDGNLVTEHGFHVYPSGVTAVMAGSGGALSAGQYQYKVCYEWTDATGATHRSQPSVAVTVTAAANDKATLTIPTLRLTAKRSPAAPVKIAVYRTLVGQPVFYRVWNFLAPAAYVLNNDPTVDTVTFVDGQADTVVQGNDQLYTTGGVVPNIAGPAALAMVAYRNRIVLLDALNPHRLWYSKQVVPGQPVEFSNILVLNIDPTGGPITALAVLDDKLLIFKQSVIFFMTGEGPADTGANNDFSVPLRINTNSGCANPRSVFTAADGVMYQSSKGFRILDRALTDHYIGADVEAYNSDTVLSGLILPDVNEVRFSMASGVTLVYDYFVRQWAVNPTMAAVGSCLFNGKFTMLTATGQVRYDTALNTYVQETPPGVPLKVATGWISFAGLAGYQRVYKMNILGEYKSSHQLQVDIYYDYDDSAPVQTVVLSPTGVPQPRLPGYEFRIFMLRQKCQAVKIKLTELTSVAAPGEGLALSGLTFEVGILPNAARVAAVASAG